MSEDEKEPESIHSKKSVDWWARSLSALSFIVSAAGLSISLNTCIDAQEKVSIHITRDITSAMDAVPPVIGIVGLVRPDKALQTRWKVSVVNTSTSATIPITDYDIYIGGFDGGGDRIESQRAFGIDRSSITLADGAAIKLPIVLMPGTAQVFTLKTVTDVSIKTYPDAPPGDIEAPKAGLFRVPGQNGFDPFGNQGSDVFGDFELDVGTVVREPCVTIVFKTGRGHFFTSKGYWYEHLWTTVSQSGNKRDLVSIPSRVCPDIAKIPF